MPYKSKTERKRELFMTLAEAINRISKQDKCSWDEARDQIRAALADNALGPLRWEDRLVYIVNDYPLVERRFWQREARIRRGRVFDPCAKQWRTLLILKHSIFQHWPEPPDGASAASENGQATENGSDVVPITKAKGGAPSAKEEIYQALDKLSHEKGHSVKDTMPRKRLAELVAKECDKVLGKSRGWTLGTVLNHIRGWPKKH